MIISWIPNFLQRGALQALFGHLDHFPQKLELFWDITVHFEGHFFSHCAKGTAAMQFLVISEKKTLQDVPKMTQNGPKCYKLAKTMAKWTKTRNNYPWMAENGQKCSVKHQKTRPLKKINEEGSSTTPGGIWPGTIVARKKHWINP